MRQEYFVEKRHREPFKRLFTTNNTNIRFRSDKAIVEYQEPYLVSEESLIEKSKVKKEWQNKINEFRKWSISA